MVIKGKARGGASALAAHLERHDTNEMVFVRELRGVTARDVRGALREMDCMGSGATSVRTLYHAAINTAPGERLTDDQKRQAADRLEKELGFTGQPRVIVEHLKKDREHMHVVFLRIDTNRMVAIPDSHNYRKHEIVARDLEREFGHQHVQGAHVAREDVERPARTPSHAEMQQAERTGLSPQAAKEQVTRIWNQADSGRAFVAAATAEGWVVAKGDKRDFVLVDGAGETHSLARRVDGVKAAEVRQRMADVDPATLPTVADAKTMQRATAGSDRTKEKEKEKSKSPQPIAPAKPVATTTVLRLPAPSSSRHAEPIVKVARTPDAGRAEVERPKPKPQPEPSRIQQLYTAAAGITQRVVDRAKKILDKKPAEEKPRRDRQLKADKIAPASQAPTAPPAAPIIVQTKPVEKPTPAPEPPKPKRMSPAELDAMLERQKARSRDRGGPDL